MFKVSKLTGIKKTTPSTKTRKLEQRVWLFCLSFRFPKMLFWKKNVKFHRLLRNVKYCATKIASSVGLMEQITYINLIGLHFWAVLDNQKAKLTMFKSTSFWDKWSHAKSLTVRLSEKKEKILLAEVFSSDLTWPLKLYFWRFFQNSVCKILGFVVQN